MMSYPSQAKMFMLYMDWWHYCTWTVINTHIITMENVMPHNVGVALIVTKKVMFQFANRSRLQLNFLVNSINCNLCNV